jgi:uncharacterized membrane protein YfcA
LTPIALLEITLVAIGGGLLQGSIGFGLGVFAVPFFLLIEPALVPGPLLAAAFFITLVMTHHERHAIQVDDLKWALGGRLVGTVAALAVLTMVPPDRLPALMGGLTLVAVAITASGLQLRPAPTSLIGAGALSGFMSTAASIGGPAIALLYQRETGARLRATLSAFFLIGIVMSLVGLYLVHRFGRHEVLLTGMLLPGTALGYLMARRVAPVLDRGYTRLAVLVVSAATAAAVVLKELL